MHESEKWKWSCSVVSYSSQPHGLQPTRLLSPWEFPGKSTGVGCHCLLLRRLEGFCKYQRKVMQQWLIAAFSGRNSRIIAILDFLADFWFLPSANSLLEALRRDEALYPFLVLQRCCQVTLLLWESEKGVWRECRKVPQLSQPDHLSEIAAWESQGWSHCGCL